RPDDARIDHGPAGLRRSHRRLAFAAVRSGVHLHCRQSGARLVLLALGEPTATGDADVVPSPPSKHSAGRLHVPFRGHAGSGAHSRAGATPHPLSARCARYCAQRRWLARGLATARLVVGDSADSGQPDLVALQQEAWLNGMPRPRTDIRPRILAAARERFAQSGVDASSLRSIASAADTSVGMIYYYFPTKDALFLAVVEDVYGALLSDLDAALKVRGDFASSALSFYQRIASVSPLELQIIRLVAREAFSSSERLLDLLPRFSRGHVALILNVVQRGIQAGELRTDVHPAVLMAATLSLGTLPQLALRALGKYLPVAPPRTAELTRQLADVLLHGVSARK